MSKTKKIAILAIIAMVLTMMPASLFAVDFDGDRIQGADRYATALAIAEAGWDTADAVVLAAGENNHLVDALAAAPLAGQENAPILLTPKAALKAEVKAAIEDLGAKTVYVVGAVSDAVVAEVEALGVDVEKLSGADRWATADAINAELDAPAGTFVVGYNAVADAMSAASYAAANGFKIVLAKADGSVDADALVGDVYIVGGEKWVKDIDGAERLAGADRFATNAKVAEGLEFDFGKVYVANGISLVDALAVAPLAAMDDAFVLLCSASDVDVLDGFKASTQFIAVGGTNAVPNKILDKLAGEESDELAVVDVEALNLVQVAVTFNQDVTGNDEVEDADNYWLEDTKEKDLKNDAGRYVEVKDVKVDGKVAVLTLGDSSDDISPIENQTDAVVKIDKVVVGEELSFDVEFNDFEIPEILDAEVIGQNDIKVTFSEPMNDSIASRSSFSVESADGKTSYRVSGLNWAKANTEVTVEVSKDLEDGDKIVLEIDGKLKDYAGFSASKKTFELTVKEDNRDIEVVSYRNAKEDGVILILNKNVKLENGKYEATGSDAALEDFYHTNSKNKASEVKIDGNEVAISFGEDEEMPAGTVYVFIDGEALVDFWGNENNSLRTKIEVVADTEAPKIEDITVGSGNRSLLVEFNENLDEKSAKKAENYVILNANKDEAKVQVRSAIHDPGSRGDNFVELRLGGELSAGSYYLEVDGVKDTKGNATDSLLEEFDVDSSAIDLENDVDVAVYVDNNHYDQNYGAPDGDQAQARYTEYTIVVDYDRQMRADGTRYAVDSLDNYAVNVVGDKEYTLSELDDEKNYSVKISVDSDAEEVEITIEIDKNEQHHKIDKLTISRVADSTGVLSKQASYTYTGSDFLVKKPSEKTGQLLIEKVKAIDTETIEIEFSHNVDTIVEEEFALVKSNGAAFSEDLIASIKSTDKDDVFRIELSEELNADATFGTETEKLYLKTLGSGSGGATETESYYGLTLKKYDNPAAGQADSIILVEDGIKPEFDDEYFEEVPGAYEASYNLTYDGTAKIVTVTLGFTEDFGSGVDGADIAATLEIVSDKDKFAFVNNFSGTDSENVKKYTISDVDGAEVEIQIYVADSSGSVKYEEFDISFTVNNYAVDGNNNKLQSFDVFVDAYRAIYP